MTTEVFGPYRLEALLGRGGMGEVWRAVDTSQDDRVVAVKLLKPGFGGDEQFVSRFRRECALASRLAGPHIVPIHRYGEIDGRLYIDMQLVRGVDLAALLDARGLAPQRAVRIVAQVADALAIAHESGMVHRDVKPPNVLVVTRGGRDHAYLIDFGIARAVDGTRFSQSGAVIGTYAYMAPEQFEGRADQRSDVYALGCVLFETLTGRPPFERATLPAYMQAHVHEAPPRPGSGRTGLPAALDDVVVRAMAKDPADRFPTVEALAEAARSAVGPGIGRVPPDGAGREDSPAPRSGAGPSGGGTDPGSVTCTVPDVGAGRDAPTRTDRGVLPVVPRGPDVPTAPPPPSAPRAAGQSPTPVNPPRDARRAGRPQAPWPSPPTAAGASVPVRVVRPRKWRLATAGVVVLALLGVAVFALGTVFAPAVERTLTGGGIWVSSVALGQVEGRAVIVAGDGDGTVRVWDATSGEAVGQPFTAHPRARSVAVGRVEGRDVVVSGGDDGAVRVWDPTSGVAVGEPSTGHTGPVLSVAVGQVEGRAVIVSGSVDKSVRVWDPVSGVAVGEPSTGHTGSVLSVAVGRVEGRDVVVSGGDDGTVRVWDLGSGAAVGRPFTGHPGPVRSVAVGQVEGRAVIVSGGDDGRVRVSEPVSGAAVGQPFTGHPDAVSSVAVGRVEGRDVVVSGGDDGTVRVWDLVSGAAVGEPFTGHSRNVLSVAVGQVEGRVVAVSGDIDGVVRTWDLTARAR